MRGGGAKAEFTSTDPSSLGSLRSLGARRGGPGRNPARQVSIPYYDRGLALTPPQKSKSAVSVPSTPVVCRRAELAYLPTPGLSTLLATLLPSGH